MLYYLLIYVKSNEDLVSFFVKYVFMYFSFDLQNISKIVCRLKEISRKFSRNPVNFLRTGSPGLYCVRFFFFALKLIFKYLSF